ncbi:hypothetical protein F2P81_023350 [Scophthalmus maximus]|uniref:Uncharacterized protein n=1 Tax=Scophthalmus maximus TaxID=52904 RepID=A0A6A4RX97_SCOMX|nr:hypothetical protein F2P81_023350 [Scophthalmus maximus]
MCDDPTPPVHRSLEYDVTVSSLRRKIEETQEKRRNADNNKQLQLGWKGFPGRFSPTDSSSDRLGHVCPEATMTTSLDATFSPTIVCELWSSSFQMLRAAQQQLDPLACTSLRAAAPRWPRQHFI